VDAALTRRIAAGCRAIGAHHVLWARLANRTGSPTGEISTLSIDSGHAAVLPASLICTPDLQGAVLFPEAGYALIGGTDAFMAGAVGEGTETARARFSRYTRGLTNQHPSLAAVADAYPALRRAWSRPSDVDRGSAAARQLALIDKSTKGTCTASEFAHGWWEARRASQSNGERIQAPLGDLFDRVFMLLEDYEVSPDLREPGDLSDAELAAAVREVQGEFLRSTDE
jgi:hypothetical protein